MSRVYRALEKAEEEKKKGKVEEPLKVFEEKIIPREKSSYLRKRFDRSKGLDLPKENVSDLPLNSFVVEEFRKLKTQVFHRLSNPPHTILVTSALPKEGKTLVALNLAKTISVEIHKKAILIDCDIRKSGIHFESISNSKGLSDYLSDGIPLSNIINESGLNNLRVILSGKPTNRSTELIGSKRMEELIQSLKLSEPDTYIIIDSSPIISTSEPQLLSKIVDGIIMVIMADFTPRETVQRALKSLDNQKIIGIVLNQVDTKASGYYYYKYYDYYRK